MADLSPESAGGFLVVSTPTGALEVTWPEVAARELHVWVLLADPRTVDPGALQPERLLANLIRVPVDPAAGRATVYVPSLRPLGVTLVLRGPDGAPLETPAFMVAPRSPSPEPAPTPRPEPEPTEAAASSSVAARSIAPTASEPTPAPSSVAARFIAPGTSKAPQTTTERQRIPLVFARAGSGPPGLRSDTSPSRGENPSDFDSLRARVAALAALAPRTPPGPPSSPEHAQAGFGVRQRFTLTRLVFPRDTLGERRHLVAQTTFIGRSDLESWRNEPPSWSFPVPPEADGVVDGLAQDDQVVFYALLVERGGAWVPASLTPSSPPFDEVSRPFILGDARRRLEDALHTSTSEPLRELLGQALASLGEPGAPA